MCGIAGFFSVKRGSPINDSGGVLRRMVRSLIHRGPDSEGFFEEPGVGIGIRRLKVIDLATGDQPISNESKSCWIVFNGEIYNYRELREELKKKGFSFKTKTDTEVILKLYEERGIECVHVLNGMYAFAIYDRNKECLFVARDPLGIKPLYYYEEGACFAFGSEIKALLQFPNVEKVLDLEAISHFLSLNYLPSPWTLFKNIRQLEGGHYLCVKEGSVRVERFWNPPFQIDSTITENGAIDTTRTLLRNAVKSQLVADVPVGAFLSGGLDSSALVALIKESRESPLETFSVGFEEASYDETPYAKKVARFFGTKHHEVFLKSDDLPQLLEKLVTQLDQPLADPAALALYKLSELTRQQVTVSLSGDGSDEIFVGYPTFHANRYLEWYRFFPRLIKDQVITPLAGRLPASTEKFSFDYRLKKFLEGAKYWRRKAHFSWRTIFSDEEKERMLLNPVKEKLEDLDSASLYLRHFGDSKKFDFTNQCLYADLRVWLAGNNLHKVDSMSMAHSLEARVPYLDQTLVEFLMRVPTAIKFKNHQSKYLLKKAMGDLLPPDVIHRKKAGWHVPFAKWFRYDLKGYLASRFDSKEGLFFRVFNQEAVQLLVREHVEGKANHSYKIWGLLILQEWFRIYQPEIEPNPSLVTKE